MSFDKIRLLGQGTYAKVYAARQKATGLTVAIKTCRVETDIPATTLREVVLLKRLNHPNLVKLFE
jgi:serine/threonine protein kinase